MNREQILNCLRLPARLDVQATADLLNFAVHDIPLLIRAKLLQPLGSPAANAPKYFASKVILQLADDPEWLSRATKTVSAYWRKKRNRSELFSEGAAASIPNDGKRNSPSFTQPHDVAS